MKMSPFECGGALTDRQAEVYIARQADLLVLQHLQAMDYVLLIEPRQQGKTSLVNAISRYSGLRNLDFLYVDVTSLDRSSESGWYSSLAERLGNQARFIPPGWWRAFPQNSVQWRSFLASLATAASQTGMHLVIALDEIGAAHFPGSVEFFSVLRDVFNSRQLEPAFRHLTFLIMGVFHPGDLIADDKISPFNIAHRVRLPDFNRDQVYTLVRKGKWPPNQAAELAERVYYWSGGQPYLTQLLCSYLGPNACAADVDVAVDRLRREDGNHLPSILKRLAADNRMQAYLARILNGEPIKFYPREHRLQENLELLGILSADEQGYCRVRNRILALVLPAVLEDHLTPGGAASCRAWDGEQSPSKQDHAARASSDGNGAGTQVHIHVRQARGMVIGDHTWVYDADDAG